MNPILASILFCISANATVIYVDSSAASTTNNSGHATVNLMVPLHPNPGWGTALPGSDWISFGSTGDHSDPGYFSPADGVLVTFTTTFFLTGAITAATLKVMADDSTSVDLNGHILATAKSTPGSTCSNTPIGCQASTEAVFSFASLAPYLKDGTNTLSFRVLQVRGSSFGLDFAGSVTDTTATPEPVPLAIVGAGLLVLSVRRWRR
jgi:hypothetical protein